MENEWVLANKCPCCGGRMVLSEHFNLTHDYLIRKDGQPRKEYKKSSEGAIDCLTAFCSDCGRGWDGDNTALDAGGVYIRGKGDWR